MSNHTISFDEWLRLDLRVGTVRACEPVPNSNKLLQFTLDDGSKTPRVIVSGIADQYTPESLLDQQVIFIANLPARKIMGIQSNGMLLTAVSEDKTKAPKLSLLCTDKNMPNGAKIG